VSAVPADNALSSHMSHHAAPCRRQFAHIIGDVLFAASSATVPRRSHVEFAVRLGDVVRGVTTTLQFGDSSLPLDNVTLQTADDVGGRDDLSAANYRYRGVVTHRYSCAGQFRAQLVVRNS